jgi:hypothetical protein
MIRIHFRFARFSATHAAVLALSVVAMSGCGGGGGGSSPEVSSAVAPVPPPPPEPAANQKPTISGSSPTAVNANTAYSFVPAAGDADGDALTFNIQNKPAWASFVASTGKLSGTPAAAEVGTYSNIAISVSDGKASSTLGPFAVTVNAISLGRATLSWTAPTENTDGTALASLSGYKIYYGTSAAALTNTIDVTAGVLVYIVEDLAPATWYFAVTAVAPGGAESDYSNIANQKI